MTDPATKKDKASNLEQAKDDSASAPGSGETPCPLNVVTPHIESEYKVVLLDRKLSAHQTGEPEKKHILPDPTHILVWVTQSNKSVKAWKKNGKLSVSPANVEVFLDEKCKKKLTKDLTGKELTGGTKKKLWLRGVKAGKFTAKLELEDPAHDKIELKDNPVEKEMSVVELEVEVHQHDPSAIATKKVDPDVDPVSTYHTNLKNEALPDQKKLSDEDKVKKGRILHEQSKAHFGRAKLVVKKLVADQWPSGTDSYEVVLNEKNVSGALAIYDKEFDGDKQPFPVKFKVSDLKSDGKTVWLEGTTKTKKWRGARLDLGLDRPAGELPKKPKLNGDWARFTIVVVSDVEVKYQPVKGKPIAWDKKKKRFYINLKDDDDGRKIKIGAKVTPKLEGVVLHFMLAPDKDNLKYLNGGGVEPTTWKWKDIAAELKCTDKKDRKDIVHLSEKTNDKGYAEKELILSRCGGHKFTPACYIEQDPHLGKYVDGHADLGKREPVKAEDAIEIWRQIWYQIAKPTGGGAPRATKTETAYEKVNTFLKAGPTQKFKKSHMPKALRDRTFYPQWMIEPGGGKAAVAVVGGHNWQVFRDNHDKFFPVTKEKKRELAKLAACVVAVDHQWDPVTNPDGSLKGTALKKTTVTKNPSDFIAMSENVVKPALEGPLVITAKWTITKKSDSSQVDTGVLGESAILIEKGRSSAKEVKVKLPSSADAYITGAKKADHKVEVELKLNAGESFLGESMGADIMAVYDPGNSDDYHDTVSHEIAHSLKQTPGQGQQANGLPDHPFWNTDMGTHCSYPHTPKVRQPFEPMTGKTMGDHECIMYESGPVPKANNSFCKVCHKYLMTEDMASFK